MGTSSFVNAKEPEKQVLAETQIIKNIHFGVFFDGTSNNMVQQAYFHTYKKNSNKKKEVLALEHSYGELKLLLEKRTIKEGEIDQTYHQVAGAADAGLDSEVSYLLNLVELKKKELSEIHEAIEKFQVEAHIDINAMHSDEKEGFSNVAILHSLLKEQETKDETAYYNIYIEGSGATDIVASGGKTGINNEKDINGLGFGVGPTGVTALVSKAIKYVYNYLSSIKGKLDENTCYHFYVFGFSRGATCARLFTQLAARNTDAKPLKCEKEFFHDTSKIKDLKFADKAKGKILFMEKEFLSSNDSGWGTIKRENVKVEFLGIYDTVASIGLIQQKDGWINGLKSYYDKVFPQYRDIYHFNNAVDYGLYIPQTTGMGFTCHICAADEFRENFALVNIGNKLPNNSIEIIVPGCHSDVGGGYVTEVGSERVLYKFIPRKTSKKDKDGNENTILSIWAKRNLSDKEYEKLKKASLFVQSPYDNPTVESTQLLSIEQLDKLGWVDRKWDNKNERLCTDPSFNHPCTVRFVDSDSDKLVKFKRHTIGGYSNIPLTMMLKFVIKTGYGWLFSESTSPYDIPEELQMFGNNIIKEVVEKTNQRLWIMPEGGYGGDIYRFLRLKYLHFTSSCQLVNWRLNLKPVETDWADFGNECNYDEDARICRIMYNGDENTLSSADEAILYMYNYSSLSSSCKPIEVKSKFPKLFKKINNGII